MLVQNQVLSFLASDYKKLILSQIPASYCSENVVLNIVLKLDLSKILRTNRLIGMTIISQLSLFEASALKAISSFLHEAGLPQPEHGVHLLVKITNCPLPIQNIKSLQFQLASFEQPDGIMVYLKDLLVTEVSQHQIFLFSATEIWSARCQCNQDPKHLRHFNRSLINVIQANANQQDKLKSGNSSEPYKCQVCSKEYHYIGRENEIFLNCQKIRCLLPKRSDKQSIFESRDFMAYGQLSITAELKPGKVISCCTYIFHKPAINRAVLKQPLAIKCEYSALLINVQVHQPDENLLAIRPENSEFFYQISQIGIAQKYCQSLAETQTILYNYEKLIESIDKFRFSYLPPSMLTTLKLSLLNSACNHQANKSLHLCLITEDLQLALRLMYISGLDIKRWPSEYDIWSLVSWVKCCRGSIIIVVNPTKKDLQLLDQFFSRKITGIQGISITFWLLCEANPKKEINIDYFGIVLDLTSEKNMNVCKQAIEQSIDLKLSAFVSEQFDSCMQTIAKPKNPRARLELMEKRMHPISEAQQEEEESESKHILQSYFLKCRDLKKTSTATLSYLYQLAQGFAYLRSALKAQDWVRREPHLNVLDSVLAIFLDEESARNKFSSSNTIFGVEISKLILNEEECQISFWDYLSQEDGTLTEHKSYMSKGEMFKKMLHKLNTLLFGEEGILTDS